MVGGWEGALEKLLSWVREIPVSLWSFRNKKHLLQRALCLSQDIKWPSWLAGSSSSFPRRVSQCCFRAWQCTAHPLSVGSKEMMVEARNDCYFSPAGRYTSLAEMIQQFKFSAVRLCEFHMGVQDPGGSALLEFFWDCSIPFCFEPKADVRL